MLCVCISRETELQGSSRFGQKGLFHEMGFAVLKGTVAHYQGIHKEIAGMFKGRQPLKNAPYWYNTPLDKLDFEWSPEETREIERICAKIHKNIEEEGGMTPLERFQAAMWGKDKDRMFMGIPHNNPYTVKIVRLLRRCLQADRHLPIPQVVCKSPPVNNGTIWARLQLHTQYQLRRGYVGRSVGDDRVRQPDY